MGELQADVSALDAAMRGLQGTVREFDRRLSRVEGRVGFVGPLADSEDGAAPLP